MAEKAIAINDAGFDELINSDMPVLVDFWAEWCGPCKMIGPVIDQIADEFQGKALISKMDVDGNSVVPSAMGIRSIPALMIFKKGQLVEKFIGVQPKHILVKALEKHM